MTALPDLQIGNPLQYGALTVFPLYAASVGQVDYLLSDEVLAEGTLTVEEVSESGSVPELLVKNSTSSRVLFLEGEELRGAKQNRVLNTTVLVAAHSTVKIPVSCVERGRWRYAGRQFRPSESHSSSKLRHLLKHSVMRSLKEGRGHSSDQGAVWAEADRQMSSLGSASETSAMADTYDSYQDRIVESRAALEYPEGATGLAVAVGSRVVALDVFDKSETCRKVWHRLLSGLVMDALESAEQEKPAGSTDVEALLERVKEAAWEPVPAVGEGEEFRADDGVQTHASALVCEGSVLHGSVVVAS